MYSFSTHDKNRYLPLIIAMMVYYNLTDAENTSWISTEVRITSKLSWCANPLGSIPLTPVKRSIQLLLVLPTPRVTMAPFWPPNVFNLVKILRA